MEIISNVAKPFQNQQLGKNYTIKRVHTGNQVPVFDLILSLQIPLPVVGGKRGFRTESNRWCHQNHTK